MSRLPTPGGDDGNWGNILNDYLSVEHNADGSLKKAGDISDAKGKADSAVQSVNSKSGNSVLLNLNDLSDVNTSGVTDGEVLVKNGSQWTPAGVVNANVLNTPTTDKQVPFWDQTNQRLDWQDKTILDPRDFGMVADCQVVTDGAMSSGSAVLTSASANFASTDVGKVITVTGASSADANVLSSTIQSRQSATQVTLSAAATQTSSSARVTWGTDGSGPMRATVTAATALINQTGKGVRIELPAGRIMWGVTSSFQPPDFFGGKIGVALPVNLPGRLTIAGQGKGATTIVLSDLCRNVFFINASGANIHATFASGSSTVTVVSVPQGSIAVGQVFTSPNFIGATGLYSIPPGTVIAAYNSGSGTITLGQEGSPSTPVTTNSSQPTAIGCVSYGFDTFQNVDFEDFDVDNNFTVGRCHALVGNLPYDSGTQNYLSFNSIHGRRMHTYNYGYDSNAVDASPTAVNKSFVAFYGNHYGVVNSAPFIGDYGVTQTSSIDIQFEDVDMNDVHAGLIVCSNIGLGAVNHYYDQIKYRRCTHTFSTQPTGHLWQTSYFICGAGLGYYGEIVDCYSNNIGDDAVEIGAMQKIVIDRCRFINAYDEAIMFRHTQDPPDLPSHEITVRDTLLSVNSGVNVVTDGGLRAAPIWFDLDSTTSGQGGPSGYVGTATGFGNIRLDRVTYEMNGVDYSKISASRTNNDIGFFIGVAAKHVELNSCRVVIENFTFDTAIAFTDMAMLVVNLTPISLGSTVLDNVGTCIVRDFDCSFLSSTISAGQTLGIHGLWPVGDGVFECDGLMMVVDGYTITGGGSGLSPSLAQVFHGAGALNFVKLRRLRGIRTGSASPYGIRIWNSNGSLKPIMIDGCDFRTWTTPANAIPGGSDIELFHAASNIGQYLTIGPNNLWQTNTQVVSTGTTGGHESTNASITMSPFHTSIAVTSTASVRTITLPALGQTPIGPENQRWVVDESNAAGTNNITLTCAGSDTFTDSTTSKAITTNGGVLKFYSNGTKWVAI